MSEPTSSPRKRNKRGPVVPAPGRRGWRGRGGGRSSMVYAPDEWRGTTVQVCGLWPFAAGSGTPMVGVPLGMHELTGATVCADPVTWFRQDLISNPSMFVLGIPGIGKSSLVRRLALGLAGYGVLPMVLGDLKPDYVDLVQAMDGQVIELGRGRGRLNILDAHEAIKAAHRLTGDARGELLADIRGRRHTIVSTLITLMRGQPPSDHEEMIVARAIEVLDEKHGDGLPPVLPDLAQVIQDGPEVLRQVAFDRGDMDRYTDNTEPLVKTLRAMIAPGRIGEMFASQTTTPMRRDRAVVFDVSSINDGDEVLQRAALMACWSTGFGAIEVANALADAGLEPRQHRFVILDELWRALRGGRGMVDRVDALTRLNRAFGVGVAMVSHTMSDLQALPDADDRMKARGFVERCAIVACGGLPSAEMELLRPVAGLTRAEQSMVVSWQDPPAWSSDGERSAPPGRGRFLIKVGERPGIPVRVQLTGVEAGLNDTNKLWHQQSRIARDVFGQESNGADPVPAIEGQNR